MDLFSFSSLRIFLSLDIRIDLLFLRDKNYVQKLTKKNETENSKETEILGKKFRSRCVTLQKKLHISISLDAFKTISL